ncbi:SusC/RagA family TonB-linked outer membrane protein [Labilibacter marinus]|uniref:SusC/RagA family TonB-linked outer membrane protein n=1 Tax=Labilibacter marinus TaxID=1477105 RepID=UPI00094FD82A|nr:TonB-dependent receptor [Labilibacter marinus]
MKRKRENFYKKLLITMMAFLSFTLVATAQNVTIKGTVVDNYGEPIPGANIVEKGTSNGTITQISGEYQIAVPSDATLIFTFIGYESQEIALTGQTTLDVKLMPSTIGLDEVVAVGYGYKKRSVVTGSISSLNSKELLQSRPADINQAFQGRAAGVVVSQASGQPGSSPKVTIRGVGTNGNSNPLYVIDGLPMNDMNSVNPNDIESLEVLKDATSAAIYGARAANGVILITTKKGKKGETTLSYDGFYGVQSAFNQPDLLNTDEYLTLMKEFYANDGAEYPGSMPTANNGIDTNWLDAITSNAPVQEHNVTATMGSEKGSVLLSLGYRDQEGIIGSEQGKSFFTRYNARMNASMDVNEFITVGANMNFTHIDKSGISTGTNGYNAVYYGLLMDPTTPVYGDGLAPADEMGFGVTTVPFGRMWNPMSFMEVSSNGFNRTERFYGNTYAKINFLKDFVFRTDFAVNFNNGRSRSFTPIYFHNASNFSDENRVNQNSDRAAMWQWENTLTYTKDFGDHHVTGLLGTSASQNTYERLGGSRVGYPVEANGNDNFWWLNSGSVEGATNYGDANAVHTIASVFGRLSYNYQEKYMAEVVVRRDGSSNFGPSNKYGVFPGMSLGWNISNEEFWNVNNFDLLKMRFSWGQNGNEAIDPFSYTSTIANDRFYTLGNGSVIAGSSPTNLVNPDVRWETSEQLNIGTDMSFYGGKLRVNMDYYTKTTKDLLFKRTVEAVRGNEAPFYNAGEIKNSGFEFQLGYNFNVGEVDFAVNANASYLKNEVVEVGNDNGYEEGGRWKTSTNVTRMEEGKPIGYFYGYKIDGIFQTQTEINSYTNTAGELTYPNAKPGDFMWHDSNLDGNITPEDRTDIGNPWPKWTYGMNISANYKGVDFSMMMHGKADVDVWMAQYRDEAYGRSNLPTFWLDRWQKQGDNNGVPRLSLADSNDNIRKASEFHVEDASFFKIGTIELGYTLPKKWVNAAKLSRVRIYTAADNVAVFTKYPMFDPEVGAMEGNILNTGLDYSMYPQARTIRFGVNVGF